ncbi:MAG: hypothetical protein ACREJ2_03550 [Planctomycetota bacterium]
MTTPPADDLDKAIEKSAKGPRRAKGDSAEVEQHPLPDQIAADRYLNSKKAARAKGLGIRKTKMIPPGTA